MSFTDEDLERLKKHADTLKEWKIDYRTNKVMAVFDIKAILARLETAEACIIPEELIGSLEEKYEAWRKAVGK